MKKNKKADPATEVLVLRGGCIAARVRIVEQKCRAVVMPVNRKQWESIKKHLLAGAAGCFVGKGGNGRLCSVLNRGELLRRLSEGNLVAIC